MLWRKVAQVTKWNWLKEIFVDKSDNTDQNISKGKKGDFK